MQNQAQAVEEIQIKPQTTKENEKISVFSKEYWIKAAKLFKSTKILTFAALICALRIAIKSLSIQIAPGVFLSFDCYVNAIGAIVCGPLVGLIIGAVSDTVGAILFPKGAYFFPFIFVEMSSTFLFALFLWNRKVTPSRAMLAKFTVNVFCNLILNTIFIKWNYAIIGADKAYPFINGVRIVKNLITFPLEAVLICVLLNALMPALSSLRFIEKGNRIEKIQTKHIVQAVVLAILSVLLILFYVFFLKEFMAEHNFKLF